MTHILAVGDKHHGRAVTRIISLTGAAAAAARVAVPFVLNLYKRVTANRYVRLAAFSVIMILATMGLTGINFDLLSINHRINCSIAANY